MTSPRASYSSQGCGQRGVHAEQHGHPPAGQHGQGVLRDVEGRAPGRSALDQAGGHCTDRVQQHRGQRSEVQQHRQHEGRRPGDPEGVGRRGEDRPDLTGDHQDGGHQQRLDVLRRHVVQLRPVDLHQHERQHPEAGKCHQRDVGAEDRGVRGVAHVVAGVILARHEPLPSQMRPRSPGVAGTLSAAHPTVPQPEINAATPVGRDVSRRMPRLRAGQATTRHPSSTESWTNSFNLAR